MAHKIPCDCLACGICLPQCPTGAIDVDEGQPWINPALCNNCEGYHEQPQCVVSCPIDLPIPSKPKKGRLKAIETKLLTSPDLFLNGKNNPFASAIVIWEACNLLSQRQSLAWQENDKGELSYERSIDRGRGKIDLKIINKPAQQSTQICIEYGNEYLAAT
jgi:Fe-S-cluster-containing dehydrogenase component